MTWSSSGEGEPTPQAPAPHGAAGHPQSPYPPPWVWAPRRGTNGLAIASMILGILWIYWLGSILALVFGYVARSQIRRTGQDGNGMAVAGIVLGWVGVATLVLLLAALAIGAVVGGGATGGPSYGTTALGR